jgi:hypothetical protein
VGVRAAIVALRRAVLAAKLPARGIKAKLNWPGNGNRDEQIRWSSSTLGSTRETHTCPRFLNAATISQKLSGKRRCLAFVGGHNPLFYQVAALRIAKVRQAVCDRVGPAEHRVMRLE